LPGPVGHLLRAAGDLLLLKQPPSDDLDAVDRIEERRGAGRRTGDAVADDEPPRRRVAGEGVDGPEVAVGVAAPTVELQGCREEQQEDQRGPAGGAEAVEGWAGHGPPRGLDQPLDRRRGAEVDEQAGQGALLLRGEPGELGRDRRLYGRAGRRAVAAGLEARDRRPPQARGLPRLPVELQPPHPEALADEGADWQGDEEQEAERR
jgi:hypothetical protein